MLTRPIFRWNGFWLLALFAAAWSAEATADDSYFSKRVAVLDITDGTLPDFVGRNLFRGNRPVYPYAVLDKGGEVYVALIDDDALVIAAKVPAGQTVTGQLVVPGEANLLVKSVRFSIPAADAHDKHRTDFLETRLSHYQRLVGQDVPGAAWFRCQVRQTQAALGRKPGAAGGARRNFVWRRNNDMLDTYALFSGGRAVSENLQLDRIMPGGEPTKATVPLDSLTGITVREFDWKPLVKNLKPDTDPLAGLIPFDQHALFFPSFEALMQLADHAALQGTPLLRAAEPRAVDARTRARYERQLCLPTSALARVLSTQLVASVAVTGGDPYLRTGSDVAVLFEARNIRALRLAIAARVAQAGTEYEQAQAVKGEIAGVFYSGMRSPDRVICSYVATLGDAVVVTNSLVQLEELIHVHQENKPSLATLDEYTFFRDRYRRDHKEEMALLILSDATIRRWCGPKWRIATSRRTRTAALLAQVQAENLPRLVQGNIEREEVPVKRAHADDRAFTLTSAGVQSDIHGTLAFHTPIIEQDFAHVTEQESQFYQRWRDDYQRNWSNFFDPIAVRFHLSEQKVSADVTVMPLIDNSEYNELIDLSRGAKIDQHAGDPHADVLVHAALALNTDSPQFKQYTNMLGMFTPGVKLNPLSWLGNAVAFYVDDDPFWDELAKAENAEDFLEENGHRLPIALHVEVKSALRLTAFLAQVRAFIEQTAPGNTVWEALEYNGRHYVRIAPSETADAPDGIDKLRIYYAPSSDGLIVTINEAVLKRALDRQKARRAAVAAGQPVPRTGRPWRGDNLCLHVNQGMLRLVEILSAEQYQATMQNLAWGNLPILNEWRRQFPDADPLQLHERYWHRRLVCPGGGSYRWNVEWQTMESTVYGHPGQPKKGPALPAALRDIAGANFGVTFEQYGLRARAELFPLAGQGLKTATQKKK